MGNSSRKRLVEKEQQSDESFPLWGVRLSFLKRWADEHVKDDKETTAQVCTRLVLPATAKRRCSMVDHWATTQKDQRNKANRFVSHSWSYSTFLNACRIARALTLSIEFTNVVRTIVALEQSRGSDLDKIFVWMDTFVVNQHEAPQRPQTWWSSTFHGAIKTIGSVILVVEPWHSPKALTRAWCL